VVIRLKVPIEMHYTVIPMGTSKVNSSRVDLTRAKGLRVVLVVHTERTVCKSTAYISLYLSDRVGLILQNSVQLM